MLTHHITRVKTFFALYVILLATAVGGGTYYFTNRVVFGEQQVYFSKKYLGTVATAFKYRTDYVVQNEGVGVALASMIEPKKSVSASRIDKAQAIPILLYHGVVKKPDGSNVLETQFKEQLFALKKAGWKTITLADLNLFLQGKKTLPSKSFLLTFDDGRKDSYYPVDPILQALDYNAVMFLITKFSAGAGTSHYLSVDEVKQMTRTGRWEFQSHTFNLHHFEPIDVEGASGHVLANRLWLANNKRLETPEEYGNRIATDFAKAKQDIENKISSPVIGLAFPFSDFAQDKTNFPLARNIVLDITKKIYPLAFYQIENATYRFNYPQKDSFLLKRIEVTPKMSGQDVVHRLEIASPKVLPHVDDFTSDLGWLRDWGRFRVAANTLTISATASSTGASTILDGSYVWKNYAAHAKLLLVAGTDMVFIGRYKDNKNYLSCRLDDTTIFLEEHVGGVKRSIGRKRNNISMRSIPIDVGIAVNENIASCLIDGVSVLTMNFVDEDISQGGVGFLTWDPKINYSELNITHLTVQ